MIKSSALHTGVGLVSRLLPYWPGSGSHGLPNFHSTSGAIIVSIVYGIGVESPDDRFLSASLDAAHALAVMLIPGKFLADVIPIRVCLCVQTVIYKHLTDLLIVRHVPDRFPGTGFKALAKETRDKFKIFVDGPRRWTSRICQEFHEGPSTE